MNFVSKYNLRPKHGSDVSKSVASADNVFGLWLRVHDKRPTYFIVMVDRDKLANFKLKVKAKKDVRPIDYGRILYFSDVAPSEEEKASFRDKYGLYAE